MDINVNKLIEDDLASKTNTHNKKAREEALKNYYQNPNYCRYCNKMIIVKENDSVAQTRRRKFCDRKCISGYRHDHTKPRCFKTCKICGNKINPENQSGLCISCFKKVQDEKRIEIWKETGNTGCGVSSTLRNCIRDYIFEKQNRQCAICHIDAQWNGKELHFILDHIDGDAANNFEYNLRLLCPNCDSQLDTYKSRNKNSARSHRRT